MITDIVPSHENDEGAAAVNEALSLLQQSADHKAELVGLKPGEVKVAKYDAHDLFTMGLAVKLHTYCPTFLTVVNPEDFGLIYQTDAEREAWRKNIRLGDIGTLPEPTRKEIANIKSRRETAYKRYANESSFFWGDVIKLGEPDAALGRTEGWCFGEWLGIENKLIAEFHELRDKLGTEEFWNGQMALMRKEYTEIGVGVYARLRDAEDLALARAEKNGQPAPESTLGTLEEVVDRFVNKLMAKIVNRREEVVAAMSMTHEIRDIPISSQMAEDQAMAEQILLDKMKVKSELDTLEKIQLEKIATAREEMKQGAQTLLADLRASTNSRAFAVASHVLKAIQKNGEVPGGSVRGIRNLVECIDRLIMVPDEQIEMQMAELRRLLSQESINDDPADVQSVMRRIAAESKLVLLELNRTVDTTREFGVPDTIVGLKRVLGMERVGTREALTVKPVEVVTGREGLRDF